jgi:Zn-dependent protease
MFLFNLSALDAAAWVVGFLVAFTIHEAAHAAAANYLGDPTAKFAGRLTLNPLHHLDPAGTIFLLLAGFGWGKPVPVNPNNFANPRAGNLLTSLAGPLSNLAAALVLAIPYNFLLTPNSTASLFVQTVIYVNLVIMVFNLLPIPPLDGGGVVTALLPPRAAQTYNHYGPVILFSLIGLEFVFNIGILWKILGPAIDIVWAVVNLATRFGG